ncbi:hypothetical protein KAU34_01300, partial [candidate division WOR-3 bacterium]|nr:hypothetical protein [candidate division WOR-3 bacterium]
MRFFVYFLLFIVIVLGGYGTFFYITEFKPLDFKIESLKRENRTLTKLVTKLKSEVEKKRDFDTQDTYKRSIIEELSK